jgi:hypothetical protein
MVSGEGVNVALKGFATSCRAVGATIDAVGSDFGMTWRGREWPLFYSQVGACVAPPAIDYTTFPYVGMDFWHDLDMVLPPGEVWDWRVMFVHLCIFYLDSVAYVYMYMDVVSIFVFADLGLRGREVDMVGEIAC